MELSPIPLGARPVRSSGCPSALGLQRLLAGELPEADAARLRSHCAGCPSCGGLLAALEQERAEFVRLLPLADFTRALEEASRPPAPPGLFERLRAWLTQGLAAPALGAVAAALLVGLVVSVSRPGGDVRLRGGPAIDAMILRVGEARPERFVSGGLAHPGDRLQFTVRPAGARHLLVVNLDDQGQLSLYHAGPSGQSLALTGEGAQLLPHSIELDTFEGQEKVFALFSDQPLRFDDVERQVDAWLDENPPPLDLASLEALPVEGVHQASLTVVKP